MQTPEKITTGFIFRLCLLFVLLITGVVFKTTGSQAGDVNQLRFSPSSTSVDAQEQDMQQLYNNMVSDDSSAI